MRSVCRVSIENFARKPAANSASAECLATRKACSDMCDERKRRPLTQLGADLWRPDHGVEHDVADPMRTFVDDFDSIIHELVLPMSQQDTLQLRNISSVSPIDCT